MKIQTKKLSFTSQIYIHGWTCLALSVPHVIRVKCIAHWINFSARMTLERNFKNLRAKCQWLWPLLCLLLRQTLRTKIIQIKFKSSKFELCDWVIKIHSPLSNMFRHLSTLAWNMKANLNDKYSTQWIWATNRFGLPAGRHSWSTNKTSSRNHCKLMSCEAL